MSTLNVLSLDWDYFIDASLAQMSMLFPDMQTESINGDIQNIIWAAHYGNELSGKELLGIKARLSELRIVKLLARSTSIENEDAYGFMAAVSHSDIYNYILGEIAAINSNPELENIDSVEIVNVDFHHDCYHFSSSVANKHDAPNKTVNCGNWVWHLANTIPLTKYTWVNYGYINEDREEFDKMKDFYSTSEEETEFEESQEGKRIIEMSEAIDLTDIEASGFIPNRVFISRSDAWTPPHLDSEFISFVEYMLNIREAGGKKFAKNYIDDKAIKDRFKVVEGISGTINDVRHNLTSVMEHYEKEVYPCVKKGSGVIA